MDPKLEMKYLRLEKSRNRLLDELEGLDDELLNLTSADGKWTINQTICHLIQVDQLTTSYVKNKVAKRENLHPSSISNGFKSLLLKLALKSGKKYKAPEAVAQVPATSSFDKLRKQWDEVRFTMEDVLTEIPEDLLDKCLFKHPYVGPLSISQTLSFLQDHFDHHLRQIHQLKLKLVR
ncbi:DinB family protein [Pontibacter sp. MBLB2868]|uniref:DinB family protein n=1 Tax=Pontibacter sp. MBLB2868 TaxID=3451555 RepID=UPI003F7549B7